jgi:hypothetical protein
VQRAVLARELSGEVDVLIVANPCFGLDFAAVASKSAPCLVSEEIRTGSRATAATAAACWRGWSGPSEDLDESWPLRRP